MGILAINFTVFAILKFLVTNYPRITDKHVKSSIDAVFKTPIKSSIIGVILVLIQHMLGINFLTVFIFPFTCYKKKREDSRFGTCILNFEF